MRIRADLHIHSHHSRATSPKLTPAYLDRWARIKGIGLLGTGDCTHPLWLKELRDQLEDAEEGCYVLRERIREDFNAGPALAEGLPEPGKAGGIAPETPRFVLSGEISTIYKADGKTRKVHHLVLLPDFKAAAAFQTALERVGNITSDGRPILGISSRDLLAVLLDADERSLLIPAHIWTPWFSALGAKSGFDSIDECYGDLASRISAIETGLSSNPPMNWAVPSLDRFAVISNSDAHSPDKLGREATVFNMERSFPALAAALRADDGIAETIEFFPQEGKYHYDGHRACGVYLTPAEAADGGGLCPVCGKALTRGVMGRVLELAERPVDEAAPYREDGEHPFRRPYRSLVPLREILGELVGTGPGSKKVEAAYHKLIKEAGDELSILSGDAVGELPPDLAAALGRMRDGEVSITPGYDGEYGIIRVAPVPSRESGKPELFEELPKSSNISNKTKRTVPERHIEPVGREKPLSGNLDSKALPKKLAAAQEAAALYNGKEALIIAGPGTGKTAVLTERIARLLAGGADPASILAITFTIKAAAELRERIAKAAAGDPGITAATFHSFCAALLREQPPERGIPQGFTVLGEDERARLIEETIEAAGRRSGAKRLGEYIEQRKRFLLLPGEERPRVLAGEPALARLAEELGLPSPEPEMEELYRAYRNRLRAGSFLDFEDLLAGTVRLFVVHPAALAEYRARFRYVLVDEYQDVNFVQYALIRLLVPGSTSGEDGRELRVIGDPNQAIYAFRGSDKRFIDRFLEDYPGAARFTLTRSFRCAPPILKAAGELAGSDGFSLEGQEDAGARLFRSSYPTEKSEAEGIARRLAALLGGTSFFAMDSLAIQDSGTTLDSSLTQNDQTAGDADLSGCAVLLRTLALAPPIVKALRDHGIPFDLATEKPWWEEEDAKAVLTLLREQRFPGKTALEAVDAAWEHLRTSKTAGKKPESGALERLRTLAALYSDQQTILDMLAVGGALGGEADQGLGIRREGVRIMSIHASKGLEFDQVFVPALEEGLLPFTLFETSGPDAPVLDELIEEEKRLLYVAMTRARRGLYLSWAASRSFKGRMLKAEPSRFLKNLEALVPLAAERPFKRRDPQPVLF